MKLSLIIALFSFSFFLNAKDFHPERLIVKIKEGSKIEKSDDIKKIKHLFQNHYVVYTNDLLKTEAKLKSNQNIDYVERDYKAKREKLPVREFSVENSSEVETSLNDPRVRKQWSLKDASSNGISVHSSYQGNHTQAVEEIIVAVVDTGVDYKHEDLKSVMWVNEKEIPGNNIDDDQNGYVDDVHGIDTLDRDSNGNATGDMMDTHDHGTHVSGIIGAKQNNGKGIAGIASKVKIMGIRTVPNSGDELDVDVIESFMYAAKHGAKIINCSFGKSHNEGGKAVSEAIEHIGEKYGVLVIAASGNSSANIDTRLTYPASFDNSHLMVVASTDSWGGMSYFSNYGKKNVDLAAPGSRIYSTTINGYSNMSGTSMASPTAAGVAAEVLSNFPSLTPLELKKALMNSVTPVDSFQGRMISAGRIDLKRALQEARSY